jgi:hypothetical protein
LARRLLNKLKLDKLYPGFEDVTGEYQLVEKKGDRKVIFL